MSLWDEQVQRMDWLDVIDEEDSQDWTSTDGIGGSTNHPTENFCYMCIKTLVAQQDPGFNQNMYHSCPTCRTLFTRNIRYTPQQVNVRRALSLDYDQNVQNGQVPMDMDDDVKPDLAAFQDNGLWNEPGELMRSNKPSEHCTRLLFMELFSLNHVDPHPPSAMQSSGLTTGFLGVIRSFIFF
ncbi:unnamed protein product [Caenorhabditis nigoni]